MRYGEGRPRIIRKVIKMDSQRRPKKARDYRLFATMERVTARTAKPCARENCPHRLNSAKWGFIRPGVEYAKVYANEGQGKFIRGRVVYSPRDYHFECVPPQYRPLVRFLKTPKA